MQCSFWFGRWRIPNTNSGLVNLGVGACWACCTLGCPENFKKWTRNFLMNPGLGTYLNSHQIIFRNFLDHFAPWPSISVFGQLYKEKWPKIRQSSYFGHNLAKIARIKPIQRLDCYIVITYWFGISLGHIHDHIFCGHIGQMSFLGHFDLIRPILIGP